TVGLANAHAAAGVRVVGINPGLTKTARVAEGMKVEARLHHVSEEEALRRSVDLVPMGRLAEPEEIASVAVFVASARASYLTGVVISMDGARSPSVV